MKAESLLFLKHVNRRIKRDLYTVLTFAFMPTFTIMEDVYGQLSRCLLLEMTLNEMLRFICWH